MGAAAMTRPLRTLLFSTLYPSSARPVHGIFVETRLRELLRSGEVETKVVAPVPWFWSTDKRWGDHASMARTPQRETRNGIDVLHPRYPLLPKIGMTTAPLLLALACAPTVRRLIAEGFRFDVLDAHYYYPDGVAAALLARWFNKPFTVTARGTDLNLIPQHAMPRAMIQWTARRADASIGVCSALVDVLRRWSIDPQRLHVMRNGVDLEFFRPKDRQAERTRRNISRFALASVGHLIERKGHHLVIGAMPNIPQADLYIAGSGPEEAGLRAQAAALGVADRVHFLGNVEPQVLCGLYNAVDVLVLASSREGWANVLLESMACGTAVVASNVWGTPEVVASPHAGLLMDELSADGVASAVLALRGHPPDRAATRRYAEDFSWGATTRGQIALFDQILAARTPVAAER